jgi:hypothetical protein
LDSEYEIDWDYKNPCLQVKDGPEVREGIWPAGNATVARFLRIKNKLVKTTARKALRDLWPDLIYGNKLAPSLSKLDRLRDKLPKILKIPVKGQSYNFVYASIIDLLSQAIATKKVRLMMSDYPVLSQDISDYSHCKRFQDIHKQVQVSSYKFDFGRAFIGDLIHY